MRTVTITPIASDGGGRSRWERGWRGVSLKVNGTGEDLNTSSYVGVLATLSGSPSRKFVAKRGKRDACCW
jgi:hypothetical protein